MQSSLATFLYRGSCSVALYRQTAGYPQCRRLPSATSCAVTGRTFDQSRSTYSPEAGSISVRASPLKNVGAMGQRKTHRSITKLLHHLLVHLTLDQEHCRYAQSMQATGQSPNHRNYRWLPKAQSSGHAYASSLTPIPTHD